MLPQVEEFKYRCLFCGIVYSVLVCCGEKGAELSVYHLVCTSTSAMAPNSVI